MSGTLARRAPTSGTPSTAPATLRLATCRAFTASSADGAQDQAIAQQDPDIADTTALATLVAMPVSSPNAALRWLRAVARSLAARFHTPADPSTPSPATGRPVARLPMAGQRAGFREFTLPRHPTDDMRQRLQVKSAGVSGRIASSRTRSVP